MACGEWNALWCPQQGRIVWREDSRFHLLLFWEMVSPYAAAVSFLHGLTTTTLPTAEGAVQVAMEELPMTLHSARVLILGFGRVGKLTAHRMGALGAKVTVAARDYEDLAWAAAYGHETSRVADLSCELGGFDLVVNTIPAPILDRQRLTWVNPEAFLLDLASAPGGVDRTAAAELGLRVLSAPGLPGRTAPVTAAAAIRDAVYHILWELEA